MRNCRYFEKGYSVFWKLTLQIPPVRENTPRHTLHTNTSFTPKRANARQPWGKTITRTATKSKRLNHCVNLFEFRLRVLGVSSCLHVWGLRGLLAYRLCTPIVFYTLLFYTSIKASLLEAEIPHHEPPLTCSPISTITTLLPVFLPDNSIDTPAKKNCNLALGTTFGNFEKKSILDMLICILLC